MGREDERSCTVTSDDADIIITNNGTIDEFEDKALALGRALYGKLQQQ